MNNSEKKIYTEDYINTKVFGWQKVKLYKLKHFIFDFGGVMVEKTFVLKNLFELIKNDLKINLPPKDNPYIKKLRRRVTSGRISSRDFLEKIFEKFFYNVKKEKEQKALPLKKPNIDYYLELWFYLYSHLTKLSFEMEELILRLHKAGYIVSLMSNTYDIHAKSNELKGFYDIFDNIFLSSEIGLIKPNLEKYRYVLNKLDTKPNKCVFIDDKIRNLVPARQLGMYVIKFESIEKFKKQLNELGIENISKNLRHEIKRKYKKYKMKKKAFKKAKKEYKRAKKEFLNKKKHISKRKMEYEQKRDEYIRKKFEYKKEKIIKEQELIVKLKID
ncbi:MAG: HAD-IA family hydrolase [Promethearchaeota archaeon]